MTSQKQSAVQETRKKTYAKPELKTYGNFAEITANVGRAGVADGCTGGGCSDHNKTHS